MLAALYVYSYMISPCTFGSLAATAARGGLSPVRPLTIGPRAVAASRLVNAGYAELGLSAASRVVQLLPGEWLGWNNMGLNLYLQARSLRLATGCHSGVVSLHTARSTGASLMLAAHRCFRHAATLSSHSF